MTSRKKEIAKFLSGAMAWHAIEHLMLAFSDALPLTVLGITITSERNMLGVVIWMVVAIALGYYGWSKSRKSAL